MYCLSLQKIALTPSSPGTVLSGCEMVRANVVTGRLTSDLSKYTAKHDYKVEHLHDMCIRV